MPAPSQHDVVIADGTGDEPPDGATRRRWPWFVAALVAVAALVGGGAWWWDSRPPAQTSPDVGFTRDMYAHHAQAVVMAGLVRNTLPDPALNTMTMDILTYQSEQQGIMRGWLEGHHVPGPDDSWHSMAWMPAQDGMSMDMPGMKMTMPGLATDAQLTQLGKLRGQEREVLFLKLMIRHHEGGVEMARAYLGLGRDQQLLTMAANMIVEQNREIGIMQGMLTDRGATATD
jgi:uncharacterized protein (DUF305 family)